MLGHGAQDSPEPFVGQIFQPKFHQVDSEFAGELVDH